MAFPVTAKDSLVTLRAKGTFIGVGVLYSSLALGVSISWFGSSHLSAQRESYSRLLFYGILLGGVIFYSFHAALFAARSLVREREEGTAELLRTSPLSPTSLIFQKMLTPFGMEWLFLIGSLPFVSLVFLLGGISFTEFLYQMVNLGFWLNTCVLIGLSASAKATGSQGVERKAGLWLLLLGGGSILIAGVIGSFTSLLSNLEMGAWQTVLQAPARVCELLTVLTPFWMVLSWTASEAVGNPLVATLIPFTDVFPRCPALLAWLLHLVLQECFFLSAVRAWKRTPDKMETKAARSRKRVFSRRKPLPFSDGWRVFEELEAISQEVRPTPLIVWIVLGSFIMLLSATLGPFTVRGLGVILTLGILWQAFGVASNSFRKERARGTTLFLLASPVPMKDVFLGKWMFYQKKVLKWVLFGFVVTLPMFVWYVLPINWLNRQYGVPGDLSALATFPVLAVSIPLTCLIGVVLGLYPNLSRWAIPIGIVFLCCGGANCGGYFLLPVAVFCAIGVLNSRIDLSREIETTRTRRLRRIANVSLLALVLVDILALIVFIGIAVGGNFKPLWQGFWGRFVVVIYGANILILPLCLAMSAWVWICRKRDRWWREKLLPGVRGKFVASG